MVRAPVLAIPDFNANFVVDTDSDASNVEFCAVLMQHDWPGAFMTNSAELCSMKIPYYGSQTLSNYTCMQKMASLSGLEKDYSGNKLQTFYKNPHSTQLEQR